MPNFGVVAAILAVSIVCQVIAAGLALRLVRVTGQLLAWTAIAVAIALMAVRRSISFAHMIAAGHVQPGDLSSELVALFISVFMVIGLARIAPFFAAIQNARDHLQEKVDERTEELRASQESYVRAQAIAHIGHWDWQVDTNRVTWSDECYRIFGRTPEQVGDTYDGFLATLHPEDRERTAAAVMESIQTGQPFCCDFRVVYPDGETIRHVQAQGVASLDPETAAPLRLMGTALDITERKRAEEALHDSEERFRRIFDDSPVPIGLADMDTRIVDLNPAFEAFLGYSRDELIEKKRFAEFTHPDERSDYERFVGRLRAGEGGTMERRYIRKDGSVVWGRLFLGLIRDSDGNPHLGVGIVADITEQKRAQEELRRYQAELAHVDRLSTLGELASGLAHEINQPLSAINNFAQGTIQRVQQKDPDPDGVITSLRHIAGEATRAGGIIRHLRDLARKGDSERTRVDIGAMVAEAESLLRPEAELNDIQVHLKPGRNIPPVNVDRIQLDQVLINLIRNGIEALSETGGPKHVTVTTAVVDGDVVEVAIADNGKAVSNEVLDQLFHPFFSTKRSGLGMGLPICRSIVESHGGRIWAESGSDGTTVRFTLPLDGNAEPDGAGR